MIDRYPIDTLADAQSSRNRAWADMSARRITPASAWAIIKAASKKWGQRLYER